jgi:hypothetical protein
MTTTAFRVHSLSADRHVAGSADSRRRNEELLTEGEEKDRWTLLFRMMGYWRDTFVVHDAREQDLP